MKIKMKWRDVDGPHDCVYMAIKREMGLPLDFAPVGHANINEFDKRMNEIYKLLDEAGLGEFVTIEFDTETKEARIVI